MTLLLLAGTGEARQIAARLKGQDVVASLAGVTRRPAELAVETRSGGFGGAAGFLEYARARGVHAVLDATHPFAAQISNRTARLCGEAGLVYCQFLRPAWEAGEGDNWQDFADETEAAAHIEVGATVFLATGRQNLQRFENLEGRRLICRQIDPPEGPFPFAGGEYLLGRPPFSEIEETALFERLKVDWLVVKNAGGTASRSKLDAARVLGIRVGMIMRPDQPEGEKAETVDEAIAWAKEQLA